MLSKTCWTGSKIMFIMLGSMLPTLCWIVSTRARIDRFLKVDCIIACSSEQYTQIRYPAEMFPGNRRGRACLQTSVPVLCPWHTHLYVERTVLMCVCVFSRTLVCPVFVVSGQTDRSNIQTRLIGGSNMGGARRTLYWIVWHCVWRLWLTMRRGQWHTIGCDPLYGDCDTPRLWHIRKLLRIGLMLHLLVGDMESVKTCSDMTTISKSSMKSNNSTYYSYTYYTD